MEISPLDLLWNRTLKQEFDKLYRQKGRLKLAFPWPIETSHGPGVAAQ